MTGIAARSSGLSARHAAAAAALVAFIGIGVEIQPLLALLLNPPEPAGTCVRFAAAPSPCGVREAGWRVSVSLVGVVVLGVAWRTADVALRRLRVFSDRSVGIVAVLALVAFLAWWAAVSPSPYISAWVRVFAPPGA